MAGIVSFTVDVLIQNPYILPELRERMKNLTPAYAAIIQDWAEGNVAKFDKGVGQESAGVDQEAGVEWNPLSPAYMKTKRRLGQPNALMVATGSLESSLTNPDDFFQLVNPQQALFGTPNDPEDAAKIAYNWNSRQVLFLSLDDQRAIQKTIHDYFELGENFQQILFAKGVEAVQQRAAQAQMDIEFQATVS